MGKQVKDFSPRKLIPSRGPSPWSFSLEKTILNGSCGDVFSMTITRTVVAVVVVWSLMLLCVIYQTGKLSALQTPWPRALSMKPPHSRPQGMTEVKTAEAKGDGEEGVGNTGCPAARTSWPVSQSAATIGGTLSFQGSGWFASIARHRTQWLENFEV